MIVACAIFGALTLLLASVPMMSMHLYEGNLEICNSGGKNDGRDLQSFSSESTSGLGFSASIGPPWGERQFALKPGLAAQIFRTYINFTYLNLSASVGIDDYIDYFHVIDRTSGSWLSGRTNHTGLHMYLTAFTYGEGRVKETYSVNAESTAKPETYELWGGCFSPSLFITVGSSLYTGVVPFRKTQYSLWHVAATYVYPFYVVYQFYLGLVWGLSVFRVLWLGSILLHGKFRRHEPKHPG